MESSRETLAEWVGDARRRTLSLAADLSDAQLIGPRLAIVNPMHWELGHVAWFQERWVLRQARGLAPMREDGDRLYDSSRVAHDTRWDLQLPSRAHTLDYLARTRDAVLAHLNVDDERERYFLFLTVFHEDMHDEAFTYTRQTLSYPAPAPLSSAPPAERVAGDARVPGGTRRIGSSRSEPFVFDNEKWAHDVEVPAFAIARAAVTQSEFLEFVGDGGYGRSELWTRDGWRWREQARAEHPAYWRRDGGAWQRRHFDAWLALEPDFPLVHVNWFEADAYCRWAMRRLPSEAEWETAAQGALASHGNLDSAHGGTVSVHAFPKGDSAVGCRQMLGNVWEWTSSDFVPYPGFSADPYEDYSKPWFGTHKVLRGGCWVTRSRMIRPAYRNFYTPDRRDVLAGFRTCAL